MTRRANVRAGAAALGAATAAGAVVLGALSAGAEEGGSEAFGVELDGAIEFGPEPHVVYAGGETASDSRAGIELPNDLGRIGVADVRAGQDESSARLTDIELHSADGPLELSALEVRCRGDEGGISALELADVSEGIELPEGVEAPEELQPGEIEPDTELGVPGVVTVTFNKQGTGPDGALTVAGLVLDIEATGQVVTFGSVTCAGGGTGDGDPGDGDGDPGDSDGDPGSGGDDGTGDPGAAPAKPTATAPAPVTTRLPVTG
ncbi:hypothetical protein SAMN06265360_102193 [Haloechinothrix alba]|uniref:Uncharacterized protein n=1 Tax=Haloechinothrix alba TaxID=664784 RepID=A0A238VGA4_9PSEU|nr:hypothetical protein [Haloechinothrix alba]SNR33097.1 hypothetical protein SAMN06265360_102193 [Haloechinothrix alba]